MRYVKARLEAEDEDEAYRIYMAALMKVSAGAKDLPWYHELIKKDEEPAESGDEIMERMRNGINKLTGGSHDGPI